MCEPSNRLVTQSSWTVAGEPAREGGTTVNQGERVSMSYPNLPSRSRTRQAADLFQPVTSAQPPSAALTDPPVAPVASINQETESHCAPALSGSASGLRQWVRRGTGLVVGTPGAVIAVAASAVLVVVMGAMTMVTTSSPVESSQAEPAPGRLPAPATPAIPDEPVTVSPLDAPAVFAPQAPATTSSTQFATVAAPQPAPTTHRARPVAVAAAAVAPPAPHHAPPLPAPPSPAPPPAAAPIDNAGSWTVGPGSSPGNPESLPTDTEPCHCNAPTGMTPRQQDRLARADQRREQRAVQRAEYRSTRTRESTISEQRRKDSRPAQPDANAARR